MDPLPLWRLAVFELQCPSCGLLLSPGPRAGRRCVLGARQLDLARRGDLVLSGPPAASRQLWLSVCAGAVPPGDGPVISLVPVALFAGVLAGLVLLGALPPGK